MKFGASAPGRQVADALELELALARSPGHLRLLFSNTCRKASSAMRTYYFDTRDGIPTRDRRGIEFPTAAGAIEHSRELARRFRDDPRLKDPDLSIAVIDESGTEIHREPVYPDAARACISFSKTASFKRID